MAKRSRKEKRQAVEKQRLRDEADAKRAKADDVSSGKNTANKIKRAAAKPDVLSGEGPMGENLLRKQRLKQHIAQLQVDGAIQPPPMPSVVTAAISKRQSDLSIALNEHLSAQGSVRNRKRHRECENQQKALGQARECATQQAQHEWAERVIGSLRSGELSTVRVILPVGATHQNVGTLDYETLFIFEHAVMSRFGTLKAQNIRPASDNTTGLQWIDDRVEQLIVLAPSMDSEQVSRMTSAAAAMMSMRAHLHTTLQ